MPQTATPTSPNHPATAPAGYVRRAGTQVLDAQGEPALVRGMGIGTWLLPEGYMWKFTHHDGHGVPAGSPREIEALVLDLVGPDRAAQFWTQFRRVFFAEADVARIAAEGFDHIRLPINSRVVMDDDGVFLDDGFALVDACVGWCRDHGLLVVLDLHGAPGGQTGTNIDDSPHGIPELFTDRRYADLTVRLWTEIARRYADDTTVAAYDLLNEPLPNEYAERHKDDLVDLYRELTSAVRAVDADHLLMYEGTHWASDVTIFTEVWDDNSLVQFHRYWAAPDAAGIASFVEVRDRLGLPLYMGEGGENGPDWLAAAFASYEDNAIGWNFWTWKKIDNPHSPAVVVPPAGWSDIQAYVAGTGPRPSPETAWATLVDLLDAVRIESCEWRPEIVAALRRRTPADLPAYAFGNDGEGRSWSTAEPGRARPLQWFRAQDAVTLEHLGGEDGVNPFSADPAERARGGRFVVELAPGDWVSYDLTVAEDHAGPQVTLVAEDQAAPRLAVSLDGVPVTGRWSGLSWVGEATGWAAADAGEPRTGARPAMGHTFSRLRVGPSEGTLRMLRVVVE